jgi:hypothetical protein
MRHRIRIGCVAVAAAGLLVAGCGRGDGTGAKVASIGGTTTTVAGSGSAGNGGGDPQERALAFAKCMREHGIDMPDPKVDANGKMTMRVNGRGVGEAKMRAAQSACQDKMGGPFGPGGGGQADPEFQEAALKYSQCMRQHGVPKFPDPQPNGGLLLRKDSGVDPTSPTFKAADKTCQQLLPRGGQTTEGGQSSGNGG